MSTREGTAGAPTAPTVRRGAPLPLAAAVAATAAAVLSFAPVAAVVALLRMAGGDGFGLAAPVRVAAAGWLLGHGVPVQAGAGVISVVPLALTALAAWRLSRAGVHVTRALGARGSGSWRRALAASGATAVAYGCLGLLLTAAVAGSGWWVEPVRAGVTFAGFGFLAASYGSLRTTGALADVATRVPVVLRQGGVSGAVAGALVLAAGAATAGIAVALDGGAAADTIAAYRTGVPGQAGLTLVCLAFAPNLAAWAASYLLGPGFSIGAGTIVRSSEVAAGPLPALPVFDGIPDGPLPSVGATLLAVPTVAGLVAGGIAARRMRARGIRWPGVLVGAAVAGPVAGAALGTVAAVAGGSLGAGQLTHLGPVAWQVGVLTAALVTPGALLGALTAGLIQVRR